MSHYVKFAGDLKPEQRIKSLDEIRNYYEQGEYFREVTQLLDSLKLKLIQNKPKKHDIIILDVDETAINSYEFISRRNFDFYPHLWEEWMLASQIPVNQPVLDFYNEMVNYGCSFIFLTGRPHVFDEATVLNIKNAGYNTYLKMMTRQAAEDGLDAAVFKTNIRKRLNAEGYRIIANIGDQESDILGDYAENSLKLPNFLYKI